MTWFKFSLKWLVVILFPIQLWAADFKIVGYLPQYRMDTIDVSVGQYLDDLIYFNLRLNADASLDWTVINESGIRKVQEIKRLYGVRTQICIGGWWTTTGTTFPPVITNDSLRSVLVQNLLDFCLEYDFDGVDYDWEHPQNETETNAYADLFEETKEAFKPHGKIVSAAVSRHYPFPKRAYDALDKIHIMAYGRAPYLSYDSVVTTAEIYLYRDIPREKLYLGTPFYGYEGDQAFTYKNIINNYNPGPEFNFTNGITFQGIYAQERRVQYAHTQNMGGMMIWEIGQDSPGEKSLLKAMHNTVREMKKLSSPKSMIFKQGEQADQLLLEFSPVPDAAQYRISLYNDSGKKVDSLETENTTIVFENLESNSLYYTNIVAVNGNGETGRSSKLLAATTKENPPKILIVNDYDEWRKPLDLVKRHAELFHKKDFGVSSAFGPEIKNVISVDENQIIDWIVGDKGHYAAALTEHNQAYIEHFLTAGGKLFISGSNIGHGLYLDGSTVDKKFFISNMRSICRGDSPENSISQYYNLGPVPGSIFEGIDPISFDNGEFGSYNVFNPDVIDPKSFGQPGFIFSDISSGAHAACSYFSGQFGVGPEIGSVVYLTIPFETIYPEQSREQVLDRIVDYFQSPTKVAHSPKPQQPQLLGNFPNPFNSGTTIQYQLAQTCDVELNIYNVLGELVESFSEKQKLPGTFKFRWDASLLPAGLYLYNLRIGTEQVFGKMLYVK
jgi:chitinase